MPEEEKRNSATNIPRRPASVTNAHQQSHKDADELTGDSGSPATSRIKLPTIRNPSTVTSGGKFISGNCYTTAEWGDGSRPAAGWRPHKQKIHM